MRKCIFWLPIMGLLSGCSLPIKMVNENIVVIDGRRHALPEIENAEAPNVDLVVNVPSNLPPTETPTRDPPPDASDPATATESPVEHNCRIPEAKALPELPDIEGIESQQRQIMLVRHIQSLRKYIADYLEILDQACGDNN